MVAVRIRPTAGGALRHSRCQESGLLDAPEDE